MSEVDPAYPKWLEKEYVESARKAPEISVANQLVQFKAGSAQ